MPFRLLLLLLLFGHGMDAAVAVEGDPDGFVDSSPGLGLMALFLILMMLVAVIASLILLGAGFAAGLAIMAIGAALVFAGVMSSSLAIGLLRRSATAGLRAFFFQLGAAAGIPSGMIAAWLVSLFAGTAWSLPMILILGGTLGLVSGLIVAWLTHFTWFRSATWLARQWEQRIGRGRLAG